MFARVLGYDLLEQVKSPRIQTGYNIGESNILMVVKSCFVAIDSTRVA